MGMSGSTCSLITVNTLTAATLKEVVSVIVPVYKHTWQGCCVMIQLQLANCYICCYVQQLAAQVRPQMFHIH